MLRSAVLSVSLSIVVSSVACSGPGPADRAGDRLRGGSRGRGGSSDDADAGASTRLPDPGSSSLTPPLPVPTGVKPRLVVKAEARALTSYGTRLVYGDTVEDGVFVVAKTGGEPKRLARRSPISRSFAIDNEEISWVASPGDAVLKASLNTGAFPATVRDRGIFADIAASRGDVFTNEVIGAGGALIRITGATAARLAAFDGAPRGLVVDNTHAFVVTPTKIFKTPRLKGELETIATGSNLEWPALTNDRLYYVGEGDSFRRRVVYAVAKNGGAPAIVARDVRDAPIAVDGNELYWFDGSRPQLRALTLDDPNATPRVIAEDDVLATPSAIAVDPTTVFAGTGSKEQGVIVAIARKP